MTEAEQLAAAQSRIAELEGANQRAAKDAAITTALAGHTFASPAAAAQVAQLLSPDIQLVNGVAVDKTMQPAAQAIAARLKQPEFSHFLAGSSRAVAAPAAPTVNPDAAFDFDSSGQPRLRENENLGAALIRVTNARRAMTRPDQLPFGLRRQGA
jgi:hypothetical protein